MLASVTLSPVTFTDPSLSSGSIIKAVHISELRAALSTARSAMSLPTSYTDDPLAPGMLLKASHVREIRDGVK